MSDKILLEDDDDAMFGDDNEEEEEEDVDMPSANPSTAVKTEDTIKVEQQPQQVIDSTIPEMTPEELLKSTASIKNVSLSSLLLPTSLPPVSPFPHHNEGPTSDRLRNAMSRITANPTRDAEAWQALITEAQSCYRQLLPTLYKLKNVGIQQLRNENDPEVELIERKLDWIEGCYGALLHYFPYAVTHYVQLVEIYLRLSALTADEEEQCGNAQGVMMAAMMGGASGASGVSGSALSNPTLNTPDQGVATMPASLLMNPTMVNSVTELQKSYDKKLDKIFQFCLGVQLDGSPALHGKIVKGESIDVEKATSKDGSHTVIGGMAQHSMEFKITLEFLCNTMRFIICYGH